MQSMLKTLSSLTMTLAVTSLPAQAQSFSDVVSYYVGIDSRTTPFNAPSALGGGAYPDAPNHNRLTFLFHHGDHFHGIGVYSYSGPAASPTLNDTNANNRIPEGYTALPPVSLQAGSGTWAGTFRSGLPSALLQDQEYGQFEIRNVHSLQGVDNTTYNSSGGRWNKPFDAAHIHLELISATSGLNIAIGSNMTALTPGNDVHVGDGDEMFSLLPIFWVAGNTPLGSTFSAEFRLTDESGSFGDSGRFFIDLVVIPEPATSLLLAGMGGLAMLRRRPRYR